MPLEPWMQEVIDREVAVHGEMRPPWAALPQFPAGSLGWRMGHGEGFLMAWGQWWAHKAFTEAERIAYMRKHVPPRDWLDWATCQVWDDDSDDADPDLLGGVSR